MRKRKTMRQREMNKSIFRDHLMMTIFEIVEKEKIVDEKVRFKIIPVYEKDKPNYGLDDLMRLVALSEKNVGNRLLTIEETVNLVACRSPYVPTWINISLNEMSEDRIIFNFETGLRFRKPSLLGNQETGHAPFKAVIKK